MILGWINNQHIIIIEMADRSINLHQLHRFIIPNAIDMYSRGRHKVPVEKAIIQIGLGNKALQ